METAKKELSENFRFKVLILSELHSDKPEDCLFSEKLIRSLSQFCDLGILLIIPDEKLENKAYKIEHKKDGDITYIKVYYRINSLRTPLFSKMINLVACMKGSFAGLALCREKFKKPDFIQINKMLFSGMLALAIKKLEGIDYVIAESNSYNSSKNFIQKLLDRLIASNAKKIIKVDSREKEEKNIAESKNCLSTGKEIYDEYRSIKLKWTVGTSEKIEINPEWVVLDIGSGHNPFRRANVLLEKEFGKSVHRSGAEALIPKDKKVIEGDATKMPFKNKEFDFAIASHVAEHISEIEKFISETERVAKRGYIEAPGPLSNFLLNEPFHLWDIRKEGEKLIFRPLTRKKPFFSFFYAIFYMNESRHERRTISTKNFFLKSLRLILNKLWKYVPLAYTKFYWDGRIKYEILK